MASRSARVEGAAAALRDGLHVAVGAHDGGVSLLRLADGHIAWRFAAAGAVKAALAVDAWRGHVWGASHGRDAFALCATTRTCAWTTQLDGAVSAPAAFDAVRRRVYFATLAGTLLAIDDADCDAAASLPREAWRVPVGAAVFGAPAVAPSTGDVLVASVDGCLRALRAADGTCRWRLAAGGPLFGAPAMCAALPDGVLLGAHEGELLCVRAADGSVAWRLPLPGRVASAASADAAPPPWWPPGTALLAVATVPGDVCVVAAPSCSAERDVLAPLPPPRIVAAARLPGEAFSAPVLHAGQLLLGCRDDWLYGLRLTQL
jgi:acyl-CoA synthetase